MAFFCGSEIGLISCQKSRIATMVKNGNKRAKILQYVIERPALMLATTLVGNNICTVCAPVLTKQIALELGLSQTLCAWLIPLVLPIFLMFPEVIPKNWFRQAPARRSVMFAPLLIFMFVILYPISKLIALFTSGCLKILGKEDSASEPALLMREDFRYLIRDSENDGVIDSEAADILDRSLSFHKLKVQDVYTPFEKIVSVSATTTISNAAELCRKHNLSRLPVKSKRGKWIGIFSIYEAIFLTNEQTWDKLVVTCCMHELYFIDSNMPLPEVMTIASKNNCRMLAVKNEKGRAIGIITPEDVAGKLFL
jgi:CBS domain containing-hemolysin-like protein